LRHLAVDPVFRFFLNRFLGVVAAYPRGLLDSGVVMIEKVFGLFAETTRNGSHAILL